RTDSGRVRRLATRYALARLNADPVPCGNLPRTVAGKRVLVVDDDPDIRELLFTALEDEGFEVVPAANGQEALAIIRTFHPDVIILDLMMPVMDGWQFVKEMRARDEDIPLVLLSAARDLPKPAKDLDAAALLEN